MFKLTYVAVEKLQRTFRSSSAPRFPKGKRWFASPDLTAGHACKTWHVPVDIP